MANVQTWGFQRLEDIYDRMVTDVEPERVDDAIFASAAAFNESVAQMEDALVTRTTERDGAFELPTSGEMQPGSEEGVPRPTTGFQEIQQGYPMWRAMDAFGWGREAYAKATVADVEKEYVKIETKAARWKIKRMLAAIFTNVSWTYKEKGRTDLTVRGLAVTGDGSIYLDQNGDLTTANHYTAQAGAISNSADPYAANTAILRAHPANVGRIVSYIGTGLVDATRALEGFYPYQPNDGLVSYGGLVDIAADMVGQYLGFGTEVIGVVGENIVVVSPRMPANYVVSIVQDVEKPLVMREEPQAILQGLQVIPFQHDPVFRSWNFFMKAGYAVRNPIAIAVRRISNGSYAIPTGFDARTLPG